MIHCPRGFINLSGPGKIGAAGACLPALLPMRFLIVDESSAFRDQLAAMLRARWPMAEAEQWDPRQRGSPREAIAGGSYSAVLLDAQPAGEDGIHWVAEIRQDQAAPPVVLISDQGGEHLAIKAMKAGASDFLRKSDLAPERLTR